MNQFQKLHQLQQDGEGFATLIVHPETPYILIAATKKDLVKIMEDVRKMKERTDAKKFLKVVVKKALKL